MEFYGFYKTIRYNKKGLNKTFRLLEKEYSKIPETEGCLENIDSGEKCGSWCCRIQSAQFLYSEFLHVLKYMYDNISNDKFMDILLKSVDLALSDDINKGCVFFDNDEKKCLCHESRAFNCRIYGIEPKDEFDKRFKKMKEEYGGNENFIIKNQCNLVKVKDEVEFSSEDINAIWENINNIENKMGIPKNIIDDNIGGSYRMPHDHIILYFMPDNVINGISAIKQIKDEKEKMIRKEDFLKSLRDFLKR